MLLCYSCKKPLPSIVSLYLFNKNIQHQILYCSSTCKENANLVIRNGNKPGHWYFSIYFNDFMYVCFKLSYRDNGRLYASFPNKNMETLFNVNIKNKSTLSKGIKTIFRLLPNNISTTHFKLFF